MKKRSQGEITEIAKHYLGQIGGAGGGTYSEFMQYYQNTGEPGGPNSGGGAFWQEIIRTRLRVIAPDLN